MAVTSSRTTMPVTVLSLFRCFCGLLWWYRWWVALSVGLVLVLPLVGGGLLWLLKLVVDEVLLGGRLDLLWPLAGLYGLLVGVRCGLEYGQARLEAFVAEGLVRDVRQALHAHLLRLSPGSLPGRPVGDLLAHLSGDVERVEALVYSAVLAVADDLASALF